MRIPKPSPSMVVATLSLTVAGSSGALAARALMNGDKLIKPHSLSGNRLRDHTLTGTEINLAGLGEVPSSHHADSATSAGYAASAGTAGAARVATTALSLGGIPASGFTRNDCSSLTGQIKGWAAIPATPTFATGFVNLRPAYNCSGQPVQAKRVNAGGYEVRFLGSPVTIAYGNIVFPRPVPSAAGFVSFAQLGPGDFDVAVTDGSGRGLDEPFAVLVP